MQRDCSRRGHTTDQVLEEQSAAAQESIWDRMQFACHLRTERLGEFTIGTQLRRSEPLAIAQLLVLYQAVTGRAAIAIGGRGGWADHPEWASPAASGL